MSYVDAMRLEAASSHSVFHQVTLSLSRDGADCLYLFFEGEEDPGFYIRHVLSVLPSSNYQEFVCNGRTSLIDLHALLTRDPRLRGRELYFIDKDDSDLIPGGAVASSGIFQTQFYSFENYIPNEHVFRRFWVEKLHLSTMDDRYQAMASKATSLMHHFSLRYRLIAAYCLLARGAIPGVSFPLNIPNLRLDRIFAFDLDQGRVKWRPGATQRFIRALSGPTDPSIVRIEVLRELYRKQLAQRRGKSYIRGKFELWAFAHALRTISDALSNHQEALRSGKPRATPVEQINAINAPELLSPLVATPQELVDYIRSHVKPMGNTLN